MPQGRLWRCLWWFCHRSLSWEIKRPALLEGSEWATAWLLSHHSGPGASLVLSCNRVSTRGWAWTTKASLAALLIHGNWLCQVYCYWKELGLGQKEDNIHLRVSDQLEVSASPSSKGSTEDRSKVPLSSFAMQSSSRRRHSWVALWHL